MEWVKQKMERARQQRKGSPGQARKKTDQPYVSIPERQDGTNQGGTGRRHFTTVWIPGIAAIWIVTMLAAWQAGTRLTPPGISLDEPANASVIHASEVARLQTRVATSRELGKQLEYLNRRIQQLSNSLVTVETGLGRVLAMTETSPAPAGKLPAVAAVQQPPPVVSTAPVSKANEPMDPVAAGILAIKKARHAPASEQPAVALQQAPSGKTPLKPLEPAAAEKPPAPVVASSTADKPDAQITAETGGPWYINLASLPSKADADRYTARVRSKDIQVEQYPATIKGKEYWRIQAGGYMTNTEAKSQATVIKEKLGLKSVWITRR